jgi:hypothetical protein
MRWRLIHLQGPLVFILFKAWRRRFTAYDETAVAQCP